MPFNYLLQRYDYFSMWQNIFSEKMDFLEWNVHYALNISALYCAEKYGGEANTYYLRHVRIQ